MNQKSDFQVDETMLDGDWCVRDELKTFTSYSTLNCLY